jgi:hypothetical protein
LIFGIEQLLARRLWLRLAAHFALLEGLSQFSSWIYYQITTPTSWFVPMWSSPLFTPALLTIYFTVAATANIVRYRDRIAAREIAQERMGAEVGRRSLQMMRAEVRSEMILAGLEKIETLIVADAATAERAMTRFSDFLLLGMRRIGRDVVPLELEVRFAAATIDVGFLLDDQPHRGCVDGAVPKIECPPGELFEFITEITRVLDGRPADVRLMARQHRAGVKIHAAIDAEAGAILLTHQVGLAGAEVA